MILSRFGIKLIENLPTKNNSTLSEGLMQNADEIINCGDAGQEGELIQRWVMRKQCTLSGETSVDFFIDRRSYPGRVCEAERSNCDFQSLYEAGLSCDGVIGCWE